MSKKQTRFIDLYLEGRASAEDINESIDAWHSGSGKQPIYDYLGMTEEEYSLWLRDPDVLPHIARAHKEHRSVREIIDSALNNLPIDARSADAAKVRSQKIRQKKVGASRQ
jgi:hypothetical protein